MRWRRSGGHSSRTNQNSTAAAPAPDNRQNCRRPSSWIGRPLLRFLPHGGATMSCPLVYLAATLLIVACTDQTDVSAPESEPADEAGQTASPLELSADRIPGGAHTALSGGATTVFDATAGAFSLPAPNLAGNAIDQHERGDEDFEDAFEPGPDAEHSGL